MKTNYLFPHRLKTISGIVFCLAILFYAFLFTLDHGTTIELNTTVFAIVDKPTLFGENVVMGFTENNVVDEILMVLLIVPGIVFAFSKEKHEDELVASIRLHSLAWATIANYAILLLCSLFIFGLPFLNVLMVAMFSQLIIFIVLFRYRIYRFNTSRQDEE